MDIPLIDMTALGSKDLIKRTVTLTAADRERFILTSRHLIEEIALKYIDFDVPLRALMEEGQKGLTLAAEKYDPEKNFPFSTYAQWWIKRKVSDVILARHKNR